MKRRTHFVGTGSSKRLSGTLVLPAVAATGVLAPPPCFAQATDLHSLSGQSVPVDRESWLDRVRLSAAIEVGATTQPALRPGEPILGHVLTDRNDRLVLNQAFVSLERPASASGRRIDIGFRVLAMVGTDARFTRLTGQFERATTGNYAFDIVEAYAQASLAFGSRSGIDVKIGEYLSPLGYEALPASSNALYSHGYIFNFGVPGKHAGALATLHLRRTLDVIAGIDRGANTSFEADNNDALAFVAGGAVKLPRVTVTALTHIGPENPRGAASLRPNRDLRYYNDLIVEWRVSDRLTSVTELNYVRDDGLRADAGGAAQYLVYQLSPVLKIAGRAEVWRDAEGAFVSAFPHPNDLIYAETGRPNAAFGGGPATYFALTAGTSVTLRWPHVASLMVRPELRFDGALAGRPFDDRRARGQFTAGVDLVVH